MVNPMNKIKNALCLCNLLSDNCIRGFEELFSVILHIRQLKALPENGLPYQSNFLDIVNPDENETSKFLKLLFQYKIQGENVILKKFVDRFLRFSGISSDSIHDPQITALKNYIDLLIVEKEYAIIFENKLKGAPYQPNQLARYIEKERHLVHDNVYIVLLPNYFYPDYIDRMPKSVWRLPENSDKKCEYCRYDRIGQNDKNESCTRCTDLFSFSKKTIVLENDFADWLISVADGLDEKEMVFKSAIYLFSDYIKGLYGKRINNEMLMNTTRFLKEQLQIDSKGSPKEKWDIIEEKIEEANMLLEGLRKLRSQISKDLINVWYDELRQEWPQMKNEYEKSLGINIKGVWIGCWCGDDNDGFPYWGFQCDNPTEEQRNMVKDILLHCGIDGYKSSGKWIAWKTDLNGKEKCEMFFKYAESKGYISRL